MLSQEEINAVVKANLALCLSQLSECSVRKFRTCHALILENKKYVVLRSYNTIVAFIDKDSGYFYDALRYVYGYTATSSQHIAKFRADYRTCILKAFIYR